MTQKKIGQIEFHPIPESLKSILKVKENTWLASFTESDCKELKIKPENLKFTIFKDSKNKIWFAQNGTGQPGDNQPPTKMEITNVK